MAKGKNSTAAVKSAPGGPPLPQKILGFTSQRGAISRGSAIIRVLEINPNDINEADNAIATARELGARDGLEGFLISQVLAVHERSLILCGEQPHTLTN